MMEQSLRGEVMKLQDLPDVVVSVSRNPRGYKLAWDFLRANWNTLIKRSVWQAQSFRTLASAETEITVCPSSWQV